MRSEACGGQGRVAIEQRGSWYRWGQPKRPRSSSGAVWGSRWTLVASTTGAVLPSGQRTGVASEPRARGSGRGAGTGPPAPWSPCPALRPALASGCRRARSLEVSVSASVSGDARCRRARSRAESATASASGSGLWSPPRGRTSTWLMPCDVGQTRCRGAIPPPAIPVAVRRSGRRFPPSTKTTAARPPVTSNVSSSSVMETDLEVARRQVGQLDGELVPCAGSDPVTDGPAWADGGPRPGSPARGPASGLGVMMDEGWELSATGGPRPPRGRRGFEARFGPEIHSRAPFPFPADAPDAPNRFPASDKHDVT